MAIDYGTPDKAFFLELAQVASDKTKTLGVLEALNIPLLQDFLKDSFRV